MNLAEMSQQLTIALTNQLNYDEEKREIIAYAIETALLAISGAFLILVFGLLLNALVPALIAAAFGGSLRRVSGGAHFNTPLKCLFSGALMYSVIGFLAVKLMNLNLMNQSFLLILLISSLLAVSILSPVQSEAKPIHSKSLRHKLKIASIVFVLLTALITYISTNSLVNISAVLGVFSQSITLLPMFNKKGGEMGL
ncbi:accessory gene regulator ArgB-like protein [Paradesulfitobacterium ferrireducens]|uniref:accessory gene regulator ArgB-like protein n=1 Tax=Paradesulfitobacterium ferrireducens TaxID=2816476 RepID=UPI001A8FDD27|nr:accessory gene regulator B family protein [Paradesulfitobacterium ferrireducens]